MKLNRYILAAATGASLLLASCSKQFIDEVKPSDGNISEDVIFSSKTGVDNALTGIYYLMRNYVGVGAQNMYGIKTIQFNFDLRADDMISDPSNWWLYENNWSDNTYGRIATAARNSQIWNLFYKVVNNANEIIAKTPGIPESDVVKAQLIGEAKALRAFAYFNLARIYQFTYAKDPNAPGVPLYTTYTTTATVGKPRASLKDMYTLILSDLQYAIDNMTTARTDKYRFNKNVVQGVMAEVYQEMAMADNTLWPKALAMAQAARTGFSLMAAADYKGGFNSVNTVECMWGLQFNASQSLSYASFFGYIEPVNTPNTAFKARYNDIYVNSSFVSLFTATDVRNQFLAATGQSSANPWKKWVTTKFQDNASQSGDYIMMRAAEMYLIEAEADAQMGQLEPAKDALYVLQLKRDASAVRSTAADIPTIISQILVERRKELYAEIGAPYFDLKRYQQPLVRTGNQWSVLNIPATDNRWRWQLPQTEFDANTALTTADQNPL